MEEIINTVSPFITLNWLSDNRCYEQPDIFTDRCAAIKLLAELEIPYDAVLKIEAGLYEFTLFYITTNDFVSSLFLSIYEDKLKELYGCIKINQSLLKMNLQELAFKAPHELNPQNWELELKKKALRDYKKNNIATTDAYKCKKCGERRSQVTQIQTRSADEPMTTFVNCLNCHTTFKF